MDVVKISVQKPLRVKINCCSPPEVKLSTKVTNPVVPIADWNKVIMSVNNKTADSEHAVVLVSEDIGSYNKQEVNALTAFSIVSNEEILDLFRKG